MKLFAKIIYSVLLLILAIIPIYINQLEPLEMTASEGLVKRGFIWGSYGYVRMGIYALVFSIFFAFFTRASNSPNRKRT